MTSITAFIDDRVSKGTSLWNFVNQYHTEFQKELDTPFMDYFLQVLFPRENYGKFVIHSEKLIEYGIVSNESSPAAVCERLASLGLTKDVDFALRNTSEQTSKEVKNKNVYFLTPKALKVCLIRAKSTYADYYLFLEDIVAYYSDYENKYFNTKLCKLEKELYDSNTTIKNALTDLQSVITQTDASSNELSEGKSEFESMMACAIERLNQMNLANPEIPHNFVIMSHTFNNLEDGKGRKIVVLASNKSNVHKAMDEKLKDKTHDWTIQIGTRCADPVAVRNRVSIHVKRFVKQYVDKNNDNIAMDAHLFNSQLKYEIEQFNEKRPKATPRRLFSKEKYKAEKMTVNHIPITWNKTSATVLDNKFIEYSRLIKMIHVQCLSTTDE